MKPISQKLTVWVCLAFLLCLQTKIFAFALLGPVQPWMQASNGVINSGDIGGPMEITNEYRWNVPVLTYGFDQSFLDYFGSNGVAAVKSAIQILNDLPPASSLVLTNYQFTTLNINYAAQAQSVINLKSQTLSLLLEHLGLFKPTRSVYVLRQWVPDLSDISNGNLLSAVFEGTNLSNYVVPQNYDPQNLRASPYINQTLYSGQFIDEGNQHLILPFSVDPLAPINSAVTEFGLDAGDFYTGLTYDDAGGLHYLLSTNNINYETLLPDIQAVGTNSFVNGAWRPGVDKITFIPQSVDSLSGVFSPMTNQFTDTCITEGKIIQQQLQRITTQPDFLFSAGNDSFRTGTTNWINNAALNNNPMGAGPGIIRPPVTIVLQKLGCNFYSSYPTTNSGWSEDTVQDLSFETGTYGSYDGSTNAAIVYPAPQTGNISMSVRMFLSHSNYGSDFQNFEWLPYSQAGTVYALQTSANLSTWSTLFAVTNNGSVCTYRNVNANSTARFYRLVPQ